MRKRDLKFQKAFGDHLRKVREQVGWTQLDLSAQSGINETQISNIENGDSGVTLQTLKALALALGKYPAELLDFPFPYKLNTDFTGRKKRNSRPGTTSLVNELLETHFFETPKSVADVISELQKTRKIKLESADTSGALLNLVKKKRLRRIGSSSGKFKYEERSSAK